MLRMLYVDLNGEDVRDWQEFLATRKLYRGAFHGLYDAETRQATLDFQRLYELPMSDGVVGDETYAQAMLLGFAVVEDPTGNSPRK